MARVPVPFGSGHLALFGGRPVRTAPLPPWPVFAEDEIAAVDEVLRSGEVNYWTGTQGRRFEQEFADFVGARHAVAVANGTVALELGLYAASIGPGDEVVVTPRSFMASASAVVARGATPVFADVSEESGNVEAESIRAVLSERSRAVIVVHLGGWPCDLTAICALAAERGLVVIEDCAQALGASWNGSPVGTWGTLATFSFCQDKIMTTGGEGGMLVTDDESLWRIAWSYKDHGKDWDAVAKSSPGTSFKWLHHRFGTNWRLTEMQAAIGRTALPKVPAWVDTRRQNASRLSNALDRFECIRVPQPPDAAHHAAYRLYAYVLPERLAEGWTRDLVAGAISAEGIPCQVGTCPEIYREQAFVNSGLGPRERLPSALLLGETSLAFLTHPTLGQADIDDACAAISKVLECACG